MERSQSPQTGQFNSYEILGVLGIIWFPLSQSPQTGQFNSYMENWFISNQMNILLSLNPLKRVNSILTKMMSLRPIVYDPESQSPQTGQFNSYTKIRSKNESKRFQKSQSPQTGQFNSYTVKDHRGRNLGTYSLNPLKRVNSILTTAILVILPLFFKSQSPQTGQFNSYFGEKEHKILLRTVSIPSNGSIQFLQKGQGWRPQPWLWRSQSPQTGQFNSYNFGVYYVRVIIISLNPLKRVNSILTACNICNFSRLSESQSPQTGQFNSYEDKNDSK